MSAGKSFHFNYHQDGDFIFAQKPIGVNTHASDEGKLGFVELLQNDFGAPLYVVHRLDKTTSGAIVFATNKQAAAKLSQLFEQHLVRKKYLFLTDKSIRSEQERTELKAQSYITKSKNTFVSDPLSTEPNSKTTFKFLRKTGSNLLWEATPQSGKPHQIRLHAQDLGMPILGDTEHGGSAHFRVCLHSSMLEFELDGKTYHWESNEPTWSSQILDAIQKRQFLYREDHFNNCLRLSHKESEKFRIDQFADQLWVYWYVENDPSTQDLKLFESIATETKKSIFVRKMNNRGSEPNALQSWQIGKTQDHWIASENGVKYNLHTDRGQSPGLFLDQRENRLWVQEHSRELRVLNLFAYTGGFSVNAALGGASEVCTVDVSSKFNDWTKENFALNELNPTEKKFQFWSQDSILFLKGTAKRGRVFDLIICDPPSFGRSKEGVFQIQKDLPELLELCLGCLEKNGKILFSTNYEGWDNEGLKRKIQQCSFANKIQISETPTAGLDFEDPDEKAPLMKSLFLTKK